MKTEDSRKFSEALAFASKKHANQQRMDGTPYILHPTRVAMYVASKGFDVRYQIVGLFHDLLEDTDSTEEELREFCDEEMLTAVRFLTRLNGQNKGEYIDNILKNHLAKEVKNADRIDNLTDVEMSTDPKFKDRYLNETRKYFFGLFSDELDMLYEKIIGT